MGGLRGFRAFSQPRTLALVATVLFVCHAFMLPVASRPFAREGRELLSESNAVGGVEERRTLESSEVTGYDNMGILLVVCLHSCGF